MRSESPTVREIDLKNPIQLFANTEYKQWPAKTVNSNWKKKVDDIRKTALQLGSSLAHNSDKLQNEVDKQVILSDPLEGLQLLARTVKETF